MDSRPFGKIVPVGWEAVSMMPTFSLFCKVNVCNRALSDTLFGFKTKTGRNYFPPAADRFD